MFWNLYANENTKIFKRSLLWIELGLVCALLAMIYAVLLAGTQTSRDKPAAEAAQIRAAQAASGETVDQNERLRGMITWPGALQTPLMFSSGNMLGGLLVIVLVGAVATQEYTWRTLHLWLSRGLPRPVLLLSKFAALLLPMLLIVLVPMVVGGVITGVFSLILNGSLHVEQVRWGQLLLGVLAVTYSTLPYAGLAFFLAIATRSTIAAIGGGVAFALLIEAIFMQILAGLGGIFTRIIAYLPCGLAQALLSPSGNGALLTPAQAALGIFAWTVALLGLALVVFQRQDLAE